MKTTLSLALLLAAGLIVTAAAPLTPEQTLDRRAIADLDFAPDGAKLVFTVTDPPKGRTRPRAIWMLDVATSQARQLTFSGGSDSSPRWAPDGSGIAFLSDRGEPGGQIYFLPMRGGEAERLTSMKDRVESFRWSPDGKRIAFLAREPKPAALEAREKDKDDSYVTDKDERHARIWMLDVATKQATQATSGAWAINQIEWLPDGAALVAVATDRPASDQWTERLYRIDLADPAHAQFHEIAAPRGPVGAIAVSPDGRFIAYVGARATGPQPHDLLLQPIDGGAASNITASLDRPISQPHWIDASNLLVVVQRGFKSTLGIVAPAGAPRLVDDLTVNPTTFAQASGRFKGTIAFAGETTTHAPELYVKAPGAAPKAVTSINKSWASIPVVEPTRLTYRSKDGTEIEASLLKPEGTAPFPTVVLVHGGPTGRWADTFEPWGQLLVSRGYAVIYPNVRGSTGYGQTFVEANRSDWGGGDFTDVMAGVDTLIAQGIADPNRLGIGGWSYGGYMAAWAVTQTTRFKAAVSGAPVIDMASEFGTEDSSAYDEWFYGTPYEKLDGFIKSSPITHVKNVKTPTLLLQGEDDRTDPIGQSQQFYRGLKRYHVETDLVLYPREPHGLREEKHLLDRLNRIVAWYDKYLKSPATTTSARPER